AVGRVGRAGARVDVAHDLPACGAEPHGLVGLLVPGVVRVGEDGGGQVGGGGLAVVGEGVEVLGDLAGDAVGVAGARHRDLESAGGGVVSVGVDEPAGQDGVLQCVASAALECLASHVREGGDGAVVAGQV